MVSSFVYVILPVLLSLSLFRKYREYKWGWCKNQKSLDGKVFLVTGANCGIGKETARELAKRKAKVIMACRNMENARLAIKDIRTNVSSGELIPMHLDLTSLHSVKTFAEQVLKDFEKIHCLINNAGVYIPMTENLKTKENYEIHFGVNHLGHFLLTNLLTDKLKKSAPSRIVIVSSGLHERGAINLEDLNLTKLSEDQKKTRVNIGYCSSKLANAYHCRELGARLKDTGVSAFAVCPGFTFTNLFRYSNVKWWQYVLFSPIAFLYLRSSLQGAQTILHCALEDNIEDNSGGFFRNCELYESTVKFDPKIQTGLWEKSEALVKL